MKKLKMHLERCTGCMRCELECMAEHSSSKSYMRASLSKPLPKTRIFVESMFERSVPVVCRHCKDPLCVSACMTGCMQKDSKTGVVTNMGHEQQCVGCWMCIMACPYGVINTSTDVVGIKGNVFSQALKCDLCLDRENPACVEGCPNEVIELVDIKENI